LRAIRRERLSDSWGQVDRAADAAVGRHAAGLAGPDVVLELARLAMEAVGMPDQHGVDGPPLDVVEQPVVAGAALA
jgi:hypothetical protein